MDSEGDYLTRLLNLRSHSIPSSTPKRNSRYMPSKRHRQKLICIRLRGGLGNQLFTFATARRLSYDSNLQLVVDGISGYSNDRFNRRPALDEFKLPVQHLTAEEVTSMYPLPRILLRKTNKILPQRYRTYISKNHLDFEPWLLTYIPKRRIVFEGYWHSHLYFQSIRSILLQELKPTDLVNNATELLTSIRLSFNTVAIHVRDFSSEDSNGLNLHRTYYSRAVSYISQHIAEPSFLVFSDNQQFAESILQPILNYHYPVRYISQSTQTTAATELIAMSLCKHLITANSTFSWWSAWLKDSPGIIITPALTDLISSNAWGYENLIPESWIQL